MWWQRHRIVRVLIGAGVVLAVFAAASMILPEKESGTPSSAKHVSQKKKDLLWANLSPAQKEILSPLEAEWDKKGVASRRGWLQIVRKLETFSPEARERGKEHIREWAELTPDQRREARQNFLSTKKLGSKEKSEQWLEYQKLPDEKKKELASRGRGKKQVANPLALSPKNTKGSTPAVVPLQPEAHPQPEATKPAEPGIAKAE